MIRCGKPKIRSLPVTDESMVKAMAWRHTGSFREWRMERPEALLQRLSVCETRSKSVSVGFKCRPLLGRPSLIENGSLVKERLIRSR